jgi:glycosyltransferase involved in cell wall biosynthesis
MYFPAARSIDVALTEMTTRFPDALHVVEGELPAAVAMRGRRRWIWSEHESLDDSIAALHSALPVEERRVRHTALAREARFVAAMQRRILARANGVIYISDRSSRRAGSRGAARLGTFLPLSIADEDVRWAEPAASATQPLRLLHLGGVSHLPTYSSLRFLLGVVFPLLSARARARMRLTVVGRFDPAHPRCAEIQQLALPYPDVAFTGFATSLPGVYAAHDAQIVASVEGAGIRTRVVESLARGLPVLATPQAVDGMPGLEAERNYIALRDAADAARTLERLVDDRAPLVSVAAAGLSLYRSRYSRRAVRDLILRTFAPLLDR